MWNAPPMGKFMSGGHIFAVKSGRCPQGYTLNIVLKMVDNLADSNWYGEIVEWQGS
jgi:hypothetical protein